MNTTENYATFVDAAASLDHYCGVAQWANEAPPLDRCDAAGLLVDAVAAQELVRRRDVSGMEVFLCSLLKRNAHGLMDPSIYNYFNCAKYCTEDYTRSIEELIAAYAAAEPVESNAETRAKETDGAARNVAAFKIKSAAKDAAACPPRQCWVHVDNLQQRSTLSPNPFSALRRGTAATSMPPANGSAAQLPAVDIIRKVLHAWRRTASAYTHAASFNRPSQCQLVPSPSLNYSGGLTANSLSQHPSIATSTCSPFLQSAASTVAPTSVSCRGGMSRQGCTSARSPVVKAKGFSRLLLGFASVGEESNYLTEDETPTPSATSAVGTPAALLHSGFPNPFAEGRRFVPDLPPPPRSQSSPVPPSPAGTATTTKAVPSAERSDATSAFTSLQSAARLSELPNGSTSALTAEEALLWHIEASCAALHRFPNSGTGFASDDASCKAAKPTSYTPASPLNASAPSSPHGPFSVPRRLRVLRQVLHSFGRTALVLSGGSSMGTYHAGVARALYEADVLPDILSGSSAGSIIAALICTKAPAELHSFMRSDVLSMEAMQMSPFGEDAGLAEKLRRFFKTGFLMDVRTLMECMRGQCGDLTFLEAYELSGKVLNVSVTRSQQEGTPADRHALLNYVTAPDVVIWSAVSASCALPGLFTAVQLIEKPPSANGAFAPYLPGELWCDGSVAQDIPRRLLTQLFGVDYLIVSQVNPYVIPFLRHPPSALVVASAPSLLSRLWFGLVAVWGWVLTLLFSLRLLSRTGACEVLFLAFAQDYGGDLTIYPVESLLTAAPDYLNLVNNPSAEYISYVSSRAQCRTWPLVTRIRCATTVERRLVQEIRRLESSLFVEGKVSQGSRQN